MKENLMHLVKSKMARTKIFIRIVRDVFLPH